jgi:lipopolysaccharide/colanic/teichoic acid biosynthesis glycosyltransferase
VSKEKLQYSILAADLLWTVVAMVLAYIFRYGFLWYGPSNGSFLTFVPPLLSTMFLWFIIFSSMKLDGFRRGWHLPAIFSQLCLGVCFLMVVLFAAGYLLRIFMSRLTFTYFSILLLVGFVGIRYMVHSILSSSFLARTTRRVVIVGNGPVARELATKIKRHPEMLCQVVGFLFSADTSFDLRVAGTTSEASTVQTLGVIELLHKQHVDEIIVAVSRPGIPEVMNLAARCRQEGICVSVVPHPYELYLSKPKLLDIGGLPILRLMEANANYANGLWKRGLDLIVGFGLLLISIPFVVAAALMLLGRTGGPFRRQARCGCDGKIFWMWRLNSDRECKQLPCFEAVLQQLSITELPQLWNVLHGEMSLVGPRPEPPERVKHYSDWQRRRLSVKPGMTGLAQVHGLREPNPSEEKARFDLQYMMQASFFFDISLLLQTVWTLTGRVAHLYKLGPTATQKQRLKTADQHLERTLPSAHSTQPSSD